VIPQHTYEKKENERKYIYNSWQMTATFSIMQMKNAINHETSDLLYQISNVIYISKKGTSMEKKKKDLNKTGAK